MAGSLGGGAGSSQTLGLPPGMSAPGSDTLGLGGFGASGINGGFGQGPGGGGRGPVAAEASEAEEGAVEDADLAAAAVAARGRGRNGNNRRGPYNGQFASFGNRRRSQPTYTGSVFMRLQNSALNAAPFSLNGQRRAEALLRHRQLRPERRRPADHSQDPALAARVLLSHLSGHAEPQSL